MPGDFEMGLRGRLIRRCGERESVSGCFGSILGHLGPEIASVFNSGVQVFDGGFSGEHFGAALCWKSC